MMQFFIKHPSGEAGEFIQRVERYLNGGVTPIKAMMPEPIRSLDSVTGHVEAALASDEIIAACNAIPRDDYLSSELGVSIEEGCRDFRRSLVDDENLYSQVGPHKAPADSILRKRANVRKARAERPIPVSSAEFFDRLCWMLTYPSPFYSRNKQPLKQSEAKQLADAFSAWFFGGPPGGIPKGWHLARLNPQGWGFYNGFYDSAFVGWRGCELRLLFQSGSD